MEPTFYYSTNGGTTFNPITAGLSENATSSKTVASSTYTNYSLTWNAKEQIDGIFSTNTVIAVRADDLEGANRYATSTSAVFTLDVKDPATPGVAVYVDATTTPAGIFFNMTDDSSFETCITLLSDYSDCTYSTYVSSSTISLVTDPDTVYVRFKDTYQNTYSASASSAETPQLIILRDLSNIETDEYQHFFAWKTVALGTPSFDHYQVWESTDSGSTYSIISNISDRTTNYYFNRNLSSSTEYYYKVNSVDANGNASFFSQVLNDLPNGQGGSDATSPTITNVTSTSVTTQSAIIKWDTDELSDSTVGYSSSPATFTTEVGVATMVDSISASGDQHEVALIGLTPNTTYYFQVQSTDPSTNEALDADGGDGYSFTTLDGPTITNVTTQNILNTQATITWNTNQASNSSVFYSTNSDMSSSTEYTVSESETQHTVTITGLTAATAYYYYVGSGIATETNGGDYYVLTTSNDTVSPVVTDVGAIGVSDNDAVITWTTNEGATSQVQFGTTSGTYTSTTNKNTNLNTNHAVNITNALTAETDYYFIVISTDGSGNNTTSSEYTFTTLEALSTETEVLAREAAAQSEGQQNASSGGLIIIQGGDTIPPTISNIEVKNITSDSATITWVSDEVGSSFVQYGLSSAYTDIEGYFDNATNHSVVLKNLIQSASYSFRVITSDLGGNITYGDNLTFTTKSFAEDLEVAPGEEAELSQENFLSILQRTGDLLRRLAGQVSVSALEAGVNQQLTTIRDLAKLIPLPLIGGQPVVEVGATTARVTWTTDKPSNSLVAFSRSSDFAGGEDYVQVVGNAEEEVLTHTVILTELEPGITYHYQVRSKTPVSPLSKSPDFVFTTREQALEITNYKIDSTSGESAVFNWTTNEVTDSKVTYIPYRNGELSFSEAREVADKVVTTIHEMTVKDFESGVIYQVEISGKDLSGNIVAKTIPTFSTSNLDLAPLVTQVQTESAILPGDDQRIQAIISWVTNEPSTSQVFYQKGFGTGEELKNKTPLDPNYIKKHVIVLTNFEPGAVYQFQVESVDSTGNITRSRTYTILTPRQKESVFQIILKNIEETFSWVGALGV